MYKSGYTFKETLNCPRLHSQFLMSKGRITCLPSLIRPYPINNTIAWAGMLGHPSRQTQAKWQMAFLSPRQNQDLHLAV